MITQIKKTPRKWAVAAIIAISLLAGCSSLTVTSNPINGSSKTDGTISAAHETNVTKNQGNAFVDQPVTVDKTGNSPSPASQNEKSIVYNNAQYGFSFTLPVSWKGYTIITDYWKGIPSGMSTEDSGTVTGPLISIRHPLWTSTNPRQDIPIMVFTQNQWKSLQRDEFHIGAAPIGPSELGHNSHFVFALPARYNFAFPAGYEEVESILKDKPLSVSESNNSDGKGSIDKYMSLLGLSKKALASTLNETSVPIDEGGLNFEKAGLRVWFKDYGKGLVVSQIFTQRKDINFNGAVIGENISSFKKALGDPVSDKNGEAHFKYKDIFLLINYDIQTGNTIGAYFLKEDY